MIQSKRKKVIVGMSGGVDSSVAAALLKDQGYEVIGLFVHFWSEKKPSGNSQEDAFNVAKKLNIPFYAVNAQEEFKEKVVGYFLKTYQNGETPNPCVFCNKNLKFRILLEKAKQFGADFVATGHYARLHREILSTKSGIRNKNATFSLYKARDENKDQSYFLYTLNQEELSKIIFPLGEFTKEEVRMLAKEKGLPVFDKKESQDICFLSGEETESFLKRKLSLKSGKIVNNLGEEIGTHQGLALYTIGQRKGINIGGQGPFYVISKDFENNRLVVTNVKEDLDLFSRAMRVGEINWIGEEPIIPSQEVWVKTRYRHPAVSAIIQSVENGTYEVVFKVPERAITPGQSAVFYDENAQVLGGGIIKKLSKIMFVQDDAQQSQQDKGRQRSNLQTQIVMAEDDLKKAAQEKEILEAELRKLEKDKDRITVEINLRMERRKKLDFSLLQLQNQVKDLKKKFNLI